MKAFKVLSEFLEKEQEIKDKALFQKKCCEHWIKECERLRKDFMAVLDKIKALEEDDYSLSYGKEEKILKLEAEKNRIFKEIGRHLVKSDIEDTHLKKVRKEMEDFAKTKQEISKELKKRGDMEDKKKFIAGCLKDTKFVKFLQKSHFDVVTLSKRYSYNKEIKEESVNADYLVIKEKYDLFIHKNLSKV